MRHWFDYIINWQKTPVEFNRWLNRRQESILLHCIKTPRTIQPMVESFRHVRGGISNNLVQCTPMHDLDINTTYARIMYWIYWHSWGRMRFHKMSQ